MTNCLQLNVRRTSATSCEIIVVQSVEPRLPPPGLPTRKRVAMKLTHRPSVTTPMPRALMTASSNRTDLVMMVSMHQRHPPLRLASNGSSHLHAARVVECTAPSRTSSCSSHSHLRRVGLDGERLRRRRGTRGVSRRRSTSMTPPEAEKPRARWRRGPLDSARPTCAQSVRLACFGRVSQYRILEPRASLAHTSSPDLTWPEANSLIGSSPTA